MIKKFIICLSSILSLACNSSTVAKEDLTTSPKNNEFQNTDEIFSLNNNKYPICISDRKWFDLRKSIDGNAILRRTKAQPSNEEIAAFICRYGRLPNEYITKNSCNATIGVGTCNGSMMWKTDQRIIGGDIFLNAPDQVTQKRPLPLISGNYYEADAGNPFNESRRLDSRVVYHLEGTKCVVYATTDHYNSFCIYPIVKIGRP